MDKNSAEKEKPKENSDDELDKTVVEINTPSQTHVLISSEQLTSLIAGINTLRVSVEELRKESSRSQNEFQQLQAQVNDYNKIGTSSAFQLPASNLMSPPLPPKSSESTNKSPPKLFESIPSSSSPYIPPPISQQMPIDSSAEKFLVNNNPTSLMLPELSETSQPLSVMPPQTQQHPQLPTLYEQAASTARRVTTFVDDAAANLYPLPLFSGDPEEWPLFFANYQDTTIEFGYTDRQNVMRLQRALKGNAKESVSSMLLYAENLPHIIEELHFNFGRSDLLVDAQLFKVQQFPAITESHLANILPLSNRVRNMVAFFKSANCTHQLANPTLLRELVNKLPPSKQYEWAKHAATILPFPTIETFADWIKTLARVVSLMPVKSTNNTIPNPSSTTHFRQHVNASHSRLPMPSELSRRVLYTAESEQVNVTCIQCSQQHTLSDCPAFNALDVNDKWNQVKQHRLCFGCLQKGHNLTNCLRRKPCGVNSCTRLHHQTLHQELRSLTTEPQRNQQVLNCRQDSQCNQLFKILPVVLSGPQGSVNVYAMFDEGSSITLLEENIATTLGLKGHSLPLTLQWYDEKTKTEASKKVAFYIKGQNNDAENYTLRDVRTVANLDLPVQTFCKENYNYMKDVPISNYKDAKPVLLIGLDNCYLGVHKDVVEDGSERPIAAGTKLGWVAYGPLNSAPDIHQPRVLHVCRSKTLEKVEKLVEEYFLIENFGVRSSDVVLESDDDIRSKKILSETTKKIGERYETGLLWRTDNTTLPTSSSFTMAKQRLLNIETKMCKNEHYAGMYKAEINKYIAKGYAKLLSDRESEVEGPTTWYLPHFGVVNPNKPSKIRIVFDAAATTSNVSLNSNLLKGPEHAQSLLVIIHKFRQGIIAVAGDIQEMFSQVKIRAVDQNSQRFLWRDGDSSNAIQKYSMTSMIFGSVCSPCCAEYVKNINATEHFSVMPRGAKAIIESTYVDDLVASFDSEMEAEDVVLEAVQINSAAGFRLRNFVSNCKELQTKLNTTNTSLEEKVNMERQSTTDKILGMFWNTSNDTFEFQFKFNKIPREVLETKRPPTKREMLGIIMAIFDPFGLLANFMVFIKLLMQSTWKQEIGWDDHLPYQLCVQWNAWWKEFQNVKNFAVKRCYSPLLPTAEEIQLHIFVDSSSSAYAAVGYFRIKRGSQIHVAFITAKTRCAPKKGMTIPRLELQAAVLGSRLATSIENCHDFQLNRIIFWSDSKTNVLWIRSKIRRYKQFVACRISEILSSSEPSQWRWLPSELNVADEATRARFPPKFEPVSRWIMGPQFLLGDEESWPKETQVLDSEHCTTEELPARVILLTNTRKSPFNYTNFSSYLRLLRVVAWVLRFANNTRIKEHRGCQTGELSAFELTTAEKCICRQIQQEVFASEIASLRIAKTVKTSSNIYQLTPYLDEEGLLRVKGRIDAAYCLPLSARRPIIIPQDHPVSRLIMYHFHHKRHHQNDLLTINELRQRFWLPHARAVLKLVKKRCPLCIILKATPTEPLMGQLPPDRLTPYVRPFSCTGVDYCGPFQIAIGRRREKRWIALFTCLTTRAVHLEVSEDLSTDAFLLCLRNFFNRRGTPVKIRSDNGTNFVGAQKELRKENRFFDLDRIQQSVSKENIEWTFNCPANPSAGGCWERLIQCVKRLLTKVLREEAPRLETFRSVLIEAENIINSRPLTDLPLTSDADEPLTPNHFLLGCLNSTQTPSTDENRVCLQKQWRIAQNLKDRLWKRWTLEYLPRLLTRSKWNQEVVPLQKDQLVIICDNTQPRSQWQKGIITNIFTAPDGQVRSAEVRTTRGILRRPAIKLAALKFSESP